MKTLFRLLGISVLIFGAILTSRPVVAANYTYTYMVGKAGNRARVAQAQRNEAIRRQEQQLQQQEQQKKQQEQAAATNNNQNAAPVPNPPSQNNPFVAATPYYGYRQLMPVSTNAAPKTKSTVQNEETPRSLPVSEFNGPAYNDSDPLLGYQRQKAEQGNPESQYAMGLRYLDGNGVVQSDALAREWLTKASANGNLKARARLRALNSPKYAGEITLDESTH